MKVNKKLFRFLFAVPFILLLTITALYVYRFYRISERSIDLGELSSISPYEEWIVISMPYAALRPKPSNDAGTSGHTRKGEIFRVKGKRLVQLSSETAVWYLTEKGWISSKSAALYKNRFRAQNASEKLLFF